MGSKETDVLENSLFYQLLVRFRRAAEHSLVARLFGNSKVLVAGVCMLLLVSLVRLLLSGLHVTVKFLSFALLVVVLLALVWPYTKPLTDG